MTGDAGVRRHLLRLLHQQGRTLGALRSVLLEHRANLGSEGERMGGGGGHGGGGGVRGCWGGGRASLLCQPPHPYYPRAHRRVGGAAAPA